MTTDVSRIQGTYKIQNANGSDIMVVDSTGTSYATPSQTNSKVIITGNLIVLGTQTNTSSTNVTMVDPTLILNYGDSFYPNNPGGGYLGGIQIVRDPTNSADLSAYMQWDQASTWHAGTGTFVSTGTFEFRVGLPTSPGGPQYAAIKANKILIDEASATLVNGKPRLNILGSDNPNSVISVAGNTNYTSNVTDSNDIPNCAWVTEQIINSSVNAVGIVDGKSYFTIIDQSLTTLPSALIGVLDGTPSSTTLPLSSGTLALYVSNSSAQIGTLEITQGRLQPVGTNYNLTLASTGTGQIVIASPMVFQASNVPVPSTGQVGIYGGNPGGGGTGVFYVNNPTAGTPSSGEFVSRKKALIYSLIF